MRFSLSSSHALLEMKCDIQISYECAPADCVPLTNFSFVTVVVLFFTFLFFTFQIFTFFFTSILMGSCFSKIHLVGQKN